MQTHRKTKASSRSKLTKKYAFISTTKFEHIHNDDPETKHYLICASHVYDFFILTHLLFLSPTFKYPVIYCLLVFKIITSFTKCQLFTISLD